MELTYPLNAFGDKAAESILSSIAPFIGRFCYFPSKLPHTRSNANDLFFNVVVWNSLFADICCFIIPSIENSNKSAPPFAVNISGALHDGIRRRNRQTHQWWGRINWSNHWHPDTKIRPCTCSNVIGGGFTYTWRIYRSSKQYSSRSLTQNHSTRSPLSWCRHKTFTDSPGSIHALLQWSVVEEL
jgi:hypothetical protein